MSPSPSPASASALGKRTRVALVPEKDTDIVKGSPAAEHAYSVGSAPPPTREETLPARVPSAPLLHSDADTAALAEVDVQCVCAALPLVEEGEEPARCAQPAVHWGMCSLHAMHVPFQRPATHEWLRDAHGFFLQWAERAGLHAWLTGRSALGAVVYGDVDPTAASGSLALRTDEPERVMHALQSFQDAAEAMGFKILVLGKHGGVVVPAARLEPCGGWQLATPEATVDGRPSIELSFSLGVDLEEITQTVPWCGTTGLVSARIHDELCTAFPAWENRLLFRSVSLSSTSSVLDDGEGLLADSPWLALGVPVTEVAAVARATSYAYTRFPLLLRAPWLQPARALLRSFQSARDPSFLQCLEQMSGLGVRVTLTPPATDWTTFARDVLPALTLVTPGTMKWPYLYQDMPRILFTLRRGSQQQQQLSAWAYVKIFRVSYTDPDSLVSKLRLGQAQPAAISTLKQLAKKGGARGCAALLHLMHPPQSDADAITVLYVDAICSSPEARGAGAELLRVLFHRILPYLSEGKVIGCLEPLTGALAPAYAAMNVGLHRIAVQDDFCYLGVTVDALGSQMHDARIAPSVAPFTVPLAPADDAKCTRDSVKENIFAPLVADWDAFHKDLSALKRTVFDPTRILEGAIPFVARAVAVHAATWAALASEEDFAPLGVDMSVLCECSSPSRVDAALARQLEVVRRSFSAEAQSVLRPTKAELMDSPYFISLKAEFTRQFGPAFCTAAQALKQALSVRRKNSTAAVLAEKAKAKALPLPLPFDALSMGSLSDA